MHFHAQLPNTEYSYLHNCVKVSITVYYYDTVKLGLNCPDENLQINMNTFYDKHELYRWIQ